MTRTRSAVLGLGLAAALVAGGTAAAASFPSAAPAAGGSSSPIAAPVTQPTAADAVLVEQLTAMREEERMARDLYQLFSDTYAQARPFSMIVRSEQRHMDSVAVLLQRYGVADPAAGRAAGSYAVPAIQALYDEWKAQGMRSLEEAEKVGVALETRDIADLERAVAAVSQADVKATFERLLAASRNHLRAFTAAVANELGTGPGMGRGPGSMGPGSMGPGSMGPGSMGWGSRGEACGTGGASGAPGPAQGRGPGAGPRAGGSTAAPGCAVPTAS